MRILGRAGAGTAEDPFGPGDPLEVARLVRRALADGRRRAVDVTALAVVADRAPDPVDLARFARRALGPAGGSIAARGIAAAVDTDHTGRLRAAATVAAALADDGELGIAVALGPGGSASAACVAGIGSGPALEGP